MWYLPFGHQPPAGELAAPAPVKNLPPLADPAVAPLVALLQDPAVRKAAHNVKYDWQVLRRAGVELAGVAYDSMLASFVLDPGRRSHAIDTLSLEHFGRPLQTYADLTGRGKAQISFAEVPVQAAAAYCAGDSATVLALHDYFAPALRDIAMEPLLRDIEMPLVEVLTDMEWEGISIDPSVFARLNAELGADLRRLDGEIATVAGEALNLNSPRQLATILFEKQQLPVLKRTKTGPSTDADVLEQLAAMGHALPRLILDYRELQKLKSTYVDTLPATVNRQHRPHPHQLQPDRRGDGAARARPTPTCRTSPSGRRGARRSGAGSSLAPAGSSWWPTTPRSSCASWRTCRATPASSKPSTRAETSTARRRRSSSPSPWTR